MKLVGYFKAAPTEYARFVVNGKSVDAGLGIAGFYLPHRTSIELTGTAIVEQQFSFTESSEDKQEVSLQGGFLYKITDPEKILAAYNFAINPVTRQYLKDDNQKLPEHVVQRIRGTSRRITQSTKLEPLLVMADRLSAEVSAEVQNSTAIKGLGLEVTMLYFSAIVPPPQIAKALGAEYREGLLEKAADAEYKRRARAVEQERTIKENELANSIALEEQRAQLVELQGRNNMDEAKIRADARRLELAVYDGMSAEVLRAHALYELGRNAARIETLTITPEILAGLR